MQSNKNSSAKSRSSRSSRPASQHSMPLIKSFLPAGFLNSVPATEETMVLVPPPSSLNSCHDPEMIHQAPVNNIASTSTCEFVEVLDEKFGKGNINVVPASDLSMPNLFSGNIFKDNPSPIASHTRSNFNSKLKFKPRNKVSRNDALYNDIKNNPKKFKTKTKKLKGTTGRRGMPETDLVNSFLDSPMNETDGKKCLASTNSVGSSVTSLNSTSCNANSCKVILEKLSLPELKKATAKNEQVNKTLDKHLNCLEGECPDSDLPINPDLDHCGQSCRNVFNKDKFNGELTPEISHQEVNFIKNNPTSATTLENTTSIGRWINSLPDFCGLNLGPSQLTFNKEITLPSSENLHPEVEMANLSGTVSSKQQASTSDDPLIGSTKFHIPNSTFQQHSAIMDIYNSIADCKKTCVNVESHTDELSINSTHTSFSNKSCDSPVKPSDQMGVARPEASNYVQNCLLPTRRSSVDLSSPKVNSNDQITSDEFPLHKETNLQPVKLAPPTSKQSICGSTSESEDERESQIPNAMTQVDAGAPILDTSMDSFVEPINSRALEPFCLPIPSHSLAGDISPGSTTSRSTTSDTGRFRQHSSQEVNVVAENPDLFGINCCPPMTLREGNTLKIVFPIEGPLKCTEKDCSAIFCSINWSSKKGNLIRHLEQYHDVKQPTVERWCSFCQNELPPKIKSHECFRVRSFCAPDASGDDLPFKCKKCTFSCAHKRVFKSHKFWHFKQERIARQREEAARTANPDTNAQQLSTLSQADNDVTSDINNSQRLANTQSAIPSQDSTVLSLEGILEPTDEQVAADGLIDCEQNSMGPLEREEDTMPNPDDPSPSDPFIEKFKLIYDNFNNETWSHFEDIVDEFIEFSQQHVKLPPLNNNDKPPKRRSNNNDPSALQKQYRRNRRSTVRGLVDDSFNPCNIKHEALIETFFNKPTCSTDTSVYQPVEVDRGPSLIPFNPTEVLMKLKGCENTAPGPDRLTYNHLRGVDREAKVLTLIFNICMKAKRVPARWKISRTIFIQKKGDLNLPENWRPIALSSTIYKLYAGLIARRLSSWIEKHDLLSKQQKGFRPFDGTMENNYMLQQIISNKKRAKSELCLGIIDIKDAFGSVPHSAVLSALKAVGAGDTFHKIIEDLYTNTKTCLLTTEGISEEIPVTTGIKQGCPLSGLLFNLAVDPILKNVQRDRDSIHVLGYADDLVLIEDSPTELQSAFDNVATTAVQIGLSVNPPKCRTAHFNYNSQKCLLTSFKLNEIVIPVLTEFEPVDYLGKPIGFNILPDIAQLDKFKNIGDSIMNSYLAPWQRIDALKSFYYPSLNHAMRTNQFGKDQWRALDDHLRPLLKDTLSLPPRASNDYLFGNTSDGLFGIPISSEDSDITRIDTCFKLLTSKDSQVKNCAWSDLTTCVKDRVIVEPTTQDLQDYLSNHRYGDTSNKYTSVWAQGRQASGRLNITWSLTEDKTVTLIIDGDPITDRLKVCKLIRAHLRSKRSAALAAAPHQGKTFPCYSAAKSSTHFHRNGDFLRFTDWRFIHKARLGLVNLNAYSFSEQPDNSKRCRQCNYVVETLPHVINHCPSYLHKITQRHNRIVDRLIKAAGNRWQVLCQNKPIGQGRLRPDIILVKDNEALVIDVTVPFENGKEAFPKARQAKIDKYKPLLEQLKGRFKKVSFEVVIVGALGSWDRANDRCLARICSKKYAKQMQKYMVSDTIRASRDIYIQHLTGTAQVDNRSRFKPLPNKNLNQRFGNNPTQTRAIPQSDLTINRNFETGDRTAQLTDSETGALTVTINTSNGEREVHSSDPEFSTHWQAGKNRYRAFKPKHNKNNKSNLDTSNASSLNQGHNKKSERSNQRSAKRQFLSPEDNSGLVTSRNQSHGFKAKKHADSRLHKNTLSCNTRKESENKSQNQNKFSSKDSYQNNVSNEINRYQNKNPNINHKNKSQKQSGNQSKSFNKISHRKSHASSDGNIIINTDVPLDHSSDDNSSIRATNSRESDRSCVVSKNGGVTVTTNASSSSKNSTPSNPIHKDNSIQDGPLKKGGPTSIEEGPPTDKKQEESLDSK